MKNRRAYIPATRTRGEDEFESSGLLFLFHLRPLLIFIEGGPRLTLDGRHDSHQPRQDAPTNLERRQPDGGPDLKQDELRGDEKEGVSDAVDGVEIVELVAIKAELER